MKKQQKILVLVLLSLFTFIVSCRKDTLTENSTTEFTKSKSGKRTTSVSEKQVIKDWLVEHDQNLNSKDKKTRELVSNNLNYDVLLLKAEKMEKISLFYQ